MTEDRELGPFEYLAWCDRCCACVVHRFGACMSEGCRTGHPGPVTSVSKTVDRPRRQAAQ